MKVKRHPLTGWNRKRLRMALAFFFLTLAVPTAVLIAYAYSQLKWEAVHRERGLAEGLVKRIDARFKEIIAAENARPFTDYSFLNVTGTAESNVLRRSPLSVYPLDGSVALGYFQIDQNGSFSTPLLPPDRRALGQVSEISARNDLRDKLLQVLTQNQLIATRQVVSTRKNTISMDEVTLNTTSDTEQTSSVDQKVVMLQEKSQQAFEQLNEASSSTGQQRLTKSLGRLEELKLSKEYEPKDKAKKAHRKNTKLETVSKRLRKEKNILPQTQQGLLDNGSGSGSVAINMFESEIDAMDFSVLSSGHFVLFRKVWKNGQRLIQGVLFEPDALIDAVIKPAFYEAGVSRGNDLTVAFAGNILSVLGAQVADDSWNAPAELEGFLLLEGRLSEPFSGIHLVFSAKHIPAGAGATVVNWLALILFLVLSVGFTAMYRLGLRQINLARQQQDFISAVSHELKTPLTSIRMYGEMLINGWADAEKSKQYYAYIFDESERLTRLINNVLQMARLTRNEFHLDMQRYTVEQLMDTVRSKVTSQVERAGFELITELPSKDKIETGPPVALEVDADYFIQIIINLVDNALKFSRKSTTKKIHISCRVSNQRLLWCVRDYGPGIAKNHLRKIFQLFYRSENELTRETLGTGIGLALVAELAQAIGARIDAVNQTPGVEFQLNFPL